MHLHLLQTSCSVYVTRACYIVSSGVLHSDMMMMMMPGTTQKTNLQLVVQGLVIHHGLSVQWQPNLLLLPFGVHTCLTVWVSDEFPTLH